MFCAHLVKEQRVSYSVMGGLSAAVWGSYVLGTVRTIYKIAYSIKSVEKGLCERPN